MTDFTSAPEACAAQNHPIYGADETCYCGDVGVEDLESFSDEA